MKEINKKKAIEIEHDFKLEEIKLKHKLNMLELEFQRGTSKLIHEQGMELQKEKEEGIIRTQNQWRKKDKSFYQP